jgi:hypothetical protein
MVDRMFKLFIKFLRKIFRVSSGILCFCIIRSRGFDANFRIHKLSIKSGETVFNFSAIGKSTEFIAVARELVNSNDIFRSERYFVSKFKNFTDDIKLVELETTLLNSRISGFVRLEDLRLLFITDRIYAIGVCISVDDRMHPKETLLARQILISICDNFIESFRILDTGNVIEKNWCLYDSSPRSVRLVYSIVPFQLVEVDLNLTDTVDFYKVKPMASQNVRNSTNFIKCIDYFLGIGHRTIDLGYDYVYIHFFLKVSNEKVFRSDPFVFQEFSKEFAMNLIEGEGDEFHVLFSDHGKGNFKALIASSVINEINWELL